METKSVQVKRIIIKPYTLSQLAKIYGVEQRTIQKWLTKHTEDIGEKVGRYFTIPQVKIILKILGLPSYAN